MSDVDDLTREGKGVSRRTLVRAGAHAAWVVPAVSVVTSAPAVAVSAIGTGTLAFTASSATGASWSKVQHNNGQGTTTYSYPFTTGSIGITNTTSPGTAIAQAGTLKITVTFPTTGAVVHPMAALSSAVPTNWTVSPTSGSASTFVFTYGLDLAPGATATLGALTFGTNATADAVVNSSTPPKTSATLTGNATVKQNSTSFSPASSSFTSSN